LRAKSDNYFKLLLKSLNSIHDQEGEVLFHNSFVKNRAHLEQQHYLSIVLR